MAELTYTRVGDYYREYRPKLWMVLVNSGKLADHLRGITWTRSCRS